MKEFDKIYVAKYNETLTRRQLAEDLNSTPEEIEKIINDLTDNGLLKIYKNIPDEEWETLEKYTDEKIKFKYYKKSKEINKKLFRSIIKEFAGKKIEFKIFDYVSYELKQIANQTIKKEQWKKIPGFNYSMSNYGRTRNDISKKIKAARIHRWMVQTDIYKDGKRYTISVPRMEASLFIRTLKPNERVTYIDGDKRNNYYKNLKIVCM